MLCAGRSGALYSECAILSLSERADGHIELASDLLLDLSAAASGEVLAHQAAASAITLQTTSVSCAVMQLTATRNGAATAFRFVRFGGDANIYATWVHPVARTSGAATTTTTTPCPYSRARVSITHTAPTTRHVPGDALITKVGGDGIARVAFVEGSVATWLEANSTHLTVRGAGRLLFVNCL